MSLEKLLDAVREECVQMIQDAASVVWDSADFNDGQSTLYKEYISPAIEDFDAFVEDSFPDVSASDYRQYIDGGFPNEALFARAFSETMESEVEVVAEAIAEAEALYQQGQEDALGEGPLDSDILPGLDFPDDPDLERDIEKDLERLTEKESAEENAIEQAEEAEDAAELSALESAADALPADEGGEGPGEPWEDDLLDEVGDAAIDDAATIEFADAAVGLELL